MTIVRTSCLLNRSLAIALLSIFLLHFRPSFQSYIDRIFRFETDEETLTLTETKIRSYENVGSREEAARSYDNVGVKQESPQRNYIVRFIDYRRTEDHRSYLEENIQLSGWRWIERRNPAAAFPTDFGLVSIEDGVREALVTEFGKLELVKDVSVDFSYFRSLSSKKLHRRGAFVDGKKRPGKMFTSMSFGEGEHPTAPSNSTISWKHKLMMQRSQVTSLCGAKALWAKGHTGAKVKMAIFDTGIRAKHPHFRNIKERTNWTDDDTLNDNLGHGTIVSGVIAGQDAECLGFAPDAEIYAFRVFTNAQISYTSWFLDAFNYAIETNMGVLNLSIGGPDYLDLPFVEKGPLLGVMVKSWADKHEFESEQLPCAKKMLKIRSISSAPLPRPQ